MPPASIGPYQIVRELGRGGMGEVYLARDTQLDRPVAIKALPLHLAQDADRLARFEREAKVLASLNHQGIGAIYGLEQSEGHRYLILEYVEGETIGERLVRGALPIEEALQVARQMAEALEVAHEKGVIHRDLKPANVMVTVEGGVKVLDFGLARTGEGGSSVVVAGLADSPTLTTPAHSPTIPGAIMGTAGYMSPEQARGRAVDRRSDIFSFGCVLYEMLTGEGPFPGETVTDSLGAILHREPEWARLPAGTPSRVRELLTSCLAKDRRNRLHDIGDARLEIERAIAGREWAAVAKAAPVEGARWRGAAGLALVAVLAGAGGWVMAGRLARPAAVGAGPTFYLSAGTPAKPELRGVVGITPDAGVVVYTAWTDAEAEGVKPQGVLMARHLDRDETKVIEGTEGAREAALSADGRWLAFTASLNRSDSKMVLKKVALDGGRPVGAPETLCDLPAGGSPTLCWASDREIAMALPWNETILAVSAAGGEPRVVLRGERAKEIESWGEIRPLVEGRSILATRWSLVGQTVKERTEVIDLASGQRTPLLPNAGGAVLMPGGYLIARRNTNSLIAARFDAGTQQVVGEPVTAWSGRVVQTFLLSRSGTLAMVTAPTESPARKLARLDEHGVLQPVQAPPRAYGGMVVVSPDGRRAAVNIDPDASSTLPTDLWGFDFERQTLTRIPTQGPSWSCAWSRDGARLAYSTVTSSGFSIWERRADGTGEATKLYAGEGTQEFLTVDDWSPDGKYVAVDKQNTTDNSEDVLLMEQGAGGGAWTSRPYLNSVANEHGLRFSPDGKWVSFCSVETGRHELYVQRFTGSGPEDAAGRVQVSTAGHDGVCWWSPDGREIRYIDGDKQVVSVQVQAEPKFSVTLPKVLYSLKDVRSRAGGWCPDGRMLVVLEGEHERPSEIGVVVNFMDGARAKLGPAK